MKDALNKSIKEEFDRLNVIAQELHEAERDPSSPNYSPAAKLDEPPPLARKVSRTLVSDTLAALSGMTSLPSDNDAPFWISGGGKAGPLTRFGDLLYDAGLIGYSREFGAVHRALFDGGFAVPLGRPFAVAHGRTPDDLPQVAARIRQLFTLG